MKMKKRLNKVLSVFLALAVLLAALPSFGMVAFAGSTNTNFVKISDASTLDDWKLFFGSKTDNTAEAGGVWMDKSVFTDASAFTGLTDAYGDSIIPDVADDSFLVALSALASNKSIVGYSHIPTDTVLVLDISGSMGPGQGANRNDAVSDLVLAANAAITELISLNNYNRVGVVLYSAEYDQGNDEHSYTLLPIDRYTATGTVTYDNGTKDDKSDDIKVGKFLETNANNRHNGNEISIASGVKNATGSTMATTTIDVVGGTFIQNGLDRAESLFKGISDKGDTVISGDGFQAGTQRKPVVVLMSDGAPTYSTTNYTNSTSYNRGNGSSSTAENAFLTQLTGAYVKEKITEYYNGCNALFYTLGLGVGNDNNAVSVLDPQNSTETIKGYWNDYLAATAGANVTLGNWQSEFTVTRNASVTAKEYVDEYFEAESRIDLFAAFEDIVNQIIIQSLYRPTLIESGDADMDGYIEFIDDIGDWMKVKKIEGIMIGNKLYTGEYLCENFSGSGASLGTVDNPTALGNQFIWAVQQRLGITSVTEARELVELAYEHGQLRYTNADNYSNYIGWYADENGKYLGFWDASHTYKQAPDRAVYVNKSYGMLGEITDGYNESDLMYVSIQVHTEIADMATVNATENDTIVPGHCQLIYRVPASLIPVVTYNITLEGTGYDDAKNIKMEIKDAEPIRLLFEVGLRNDINELNIAEVLGNDYLVTDTADPDYGKYKLYTNAWSQAQFDKEISDEGDAGHIAPSEAINTVAYFEPNHSNERYYYTEPTPVYIYDAASGEHVKYASSAKPVSTDGNEYYRQINVFKYTDSILDGNAAELVKIYERISDFALAEVVAAETAGNWNIPKDIIHRTLDHYNIEKHDANGDYYNPTGTIRYSDYSAVEHSDTHYYADTILGNNGLLTVTPATGIKLTKQVDATLAGTTEDFIFNLDIGQEAATYDVIYQNPNGEYIDDATDLTLDEDGKGTLNLKAGWTAFIIGLPNGVAYSIEEDTANKGYKVETATNASGTIVQHTLADVDFVNTIKGEGRLIISKEVTHPFGTDPAALAGKQFEFEVTLKNGTATYPDATARAWYSTDTATVTPLTVTANKITGIKLHDNQAIVIELEEGWTAEVTEVGLANLPGFAVDNNATVIPVSPVISDSANVVYEFVNNYTPGGVSPDIEIEATKTFTGRPWDGDTFTFTLSRYNPATAEYVSIGSESVTNNTAGVTSVDFGAQLTAAIKAQVFTQAGTYHFTVIENVPDKTFGITYDPTGRYFDVVVGAGDMNGALEIIDVRAVNHTTVTGTGAYTVTAQDFVNTYAASGIAEVIIDIQKIVDTASGEAYDSLEGFEFGFYDENGALVGTTDTTDSEGKAVFVFAYNADGVTYVTPKTYKYVLKETNSRIPGMTYATDIDVTVTVTDNLDGTIKAETDITTHTAAGVPLINVTNHYNADDAEVTVNIGVQKKVENEGTATIGPENFEFVLENNETHAAQRLTSGVDGKVQFPALTFTEVGTHTYTLTEANTGRENVTYSQAVYNIVIDVTLNADNKLVADVTVNGSPVTGDIVAEFVNVYDEDAPTPPAPNPEPPKPQTGDNSNLSLWTALLFVSGTAFGFAAFGKKETEEQN